MSTPAVRKSLVDEATNIDAILASITKLGAASIRDVAGDINLHKETIRRHAKMLVSIGRLRLIDLGCKHPRSIYGPAVDDGTPEIEYSRINCPATQMGMWRMDCVAAFFGVTEMAPGYARIGGVPA